MHDFIVFYSDCVALQSPYCAWHRGEAKCVTIPLGRPISRRDYIQNVTSGNHSDCPAPPPIATSSSPIGSNAMPSERHKSASNTIGPSGSQPITILSDSEQTNDVS